MSSLEEERCVDEVTASLAAADVKAAEEDTATAQTKENVGSEETAAGEADSDIVSNLQTENRCEKRVGNRLIWLARHAARLRDYIPYW